MLRLDMQLSIDCVLCQVQHEAEETVEHQGNDTTWHNQMAELVIDEFNF
jgi:hypothetical protein